MGVFSSINDISHKAYPTSANVQTWTLLRTLPKDCLIIFDHFTAETIVFETDKQQIKMPEFNVVVFAGDYAGPEVGVESYDMF